MNEYSARPRPYSTFCHLLTSDPFVQTSRSFVLRHFIRVAVARKICARQRLRGDPRDVAAKAVLDEVKAAGGDGGVNALDAQGRASLPYNTAGMVCGTLDAQGEIEIAIWED